MDKEFSSIRIPVYAIREEEYTKKPDKVLQSFDNVMSHMHSKGWSLTRMLVITMRQHTLHESEVILFFERETDSTGIQS